MLRSMTGFAARDGAVEGLGWRWEARSVNGRGLDVRLRLGEAAEVLEPAVRAALKDRVARGSVTVSLRISRAAVGTPRMSASALAAALDQVRAVEAAAAEAGLALAPVRATDLMGLRGLEAAEDASLPLEAIAADLAPLVAALVAARAEEGAALAKTLTDQLDRVAAMVEQAGATAEARAARSGDLLKARLARLDMAEVPPDRLAQELALLAIRADVTEELDRLAAHIAAARTLLADGGPVGRRLDFLVQEFMREANTLCSKSADTNLTTVGLDLKAVLDQMREQVQNVE